MAAEGSATPWSEPSEQGGREVAVVTSSARGRPSRRASRHFSRIDTPVPRPPIDSDRQDLCLAGGIGNPYYPGFTN